MPDAESNIPHSKSPDSNRAVLQALAERVGLFVPGALILSHEDEDADPVGDSGIDPDNDAT
ncbi:hypothetical protein [Variovorax sp. J22R203]|uniref:hypothetical protein n=1 Tax=Variovorax sp. J22R203 TaxID=3053512 RepID=UPI00257555E3|nr:hypothetical protein [Variovorax sp. J22R203]